MEAMMRQLWHDSYIEAMMRQLWHDSYMEAMMRRHNMAGHLHENLRVLYVG
jgi:hypothetical protein